MPDEASTTSFLSHALLSLLFFQQTLFGALLRPFSKPHPRHLLALTTLVLVLALSLVENSRAENLSSNADSILGQPPSPRTHPSRRKRDSEPSWDFSKCDPIGWLDFYNPKFECGAWTKSGYISENGSSYQINQLHSQDLVFNSTGMERVCIPLSRRCDLVVDCPDGSDEMGCFQQFCDYPSDFLCEFDLTCIPIGAVCDGRFDCSDKSDELNPQLFCHLKETKQCEVGYGAIPCDGNCLPDDKICDGHFDCHNQLDESYVACHYLDITKSDESVQSSCGLHHFQCGSKLNISGQPKCLELSKVCDGSPDCEDASDEILCNGTERLSCENSILLRNCPNSNATVCKLLVSKHDHTSCSIPECPFGLNDLENVTLCDPICPNPEDKICSWRPEMLVELPEAQLSAENVLECLHHSKFCNSFVECSNEADELLCAALSCENPTDFHCGGVAGQCINASKRCDGFADCFNATDEVGCQEKEIHCSPIQFFCPIGNESLANDVSGRCIELTHACDAQLMPCLKGEEKEMCKSLCRNKAEGFCGSDAVCKDTPLGSVCDCNLEGFVYDEDSGHCVDIDECHPDVSKKPLPCDQNCTNNIGSYSCSCYPGYYLDPLDNSSCIAEEQNAFLLLTHSHLTVIDLRPSSELDPSASSYMSADHVTPVSVLDEDSEEVIKSRHYLLNVKYPKAVELEYHYISFATFDYTHRLIYFADSKTKSIYKAKLPSWDLNELLRKDTQLNETSIFIDGNQIMSERGTKLMSEGMAVDYSSGNLYWVERQPTTQIHVTSADAKHDISLVNTELSQPREISLHVPKKLVFWVDWGTDSIERCNFDGTQRRILLSKERFDFINSVAVDEFSDRIYFVDAKYKEIGFADLDGNNRGFVLKAPGTVFVRPFSLTLFESSLYWSDWGYGKIPAKVHKCNKLACHLDKESMPGEFHGSLHLTVVHRTLQDLRRVDASCMNNNGNCGPDNFCMPSFGRDDDPTRTHSCYRPVLRTSHTPSIDQEEKLDCSSEKENCLLSAWQPKAGETGTSSEYLCYCGPKSEPDIAAYEGEDGLSSWMVFVAVLLVIVGAACAIGSLIYCCTRPQFSRRDQSARPASGGRANKTPKITVVDGKYEETTFVSNGNPTANGLDIYGPPPESPSYSPAEEAKEIFFSFDVNQPGSVSVSYRRPSIRSRSALPSIKEETHEEEAYEESDDVCNSSSNNSNSRNYSNGSSTAVVCPSDDEVFESDQSEFAKLNSLKSSSEA